MGSNYAANDNQFIAIYSSPIDWIQNIRGWRDRKTDGCNAGGK